MYRKIDDFMKDWAHEKEATLKIFGNLTDESLAQRVTPEGRSLQDLAWHITGTLAEMMGHAGISIDAPDDTQPAPAAISEIIEIYRRAAEAFTAGLPQQWSDADLPQEVMMYGQTWRKGDVLSALLFHQTHHRAQMTVLMRQSGLKVPGAYGPSKEEWEQFKNMDGK